MRLDKILRNSGAVIVKGDSAVEIDAICNDSRKVVRGSVFVAVKGFATDGHEYISRAIGLGARAIVYEDEQAAKFQLASTDTEGITLIKTESSR